MNDCVLCHRFQSTLLHLSILASSQFHMLVAMKEVSILWRLYYCIKYKVVQSVKRIFSSIVFLFLEGASNIILRESGGVLKVEHFKLLNQLKSLLVLLIGDLGACNLPAAHKIEGGGSSQPDGLSLMFYVNT